jgi:hypothetical protein
MTSISNGESGSSVRTKLNNSLAVTDAFSVSGGNLSVTTNSASSAFTITQTGAGNSFVVEDLTSPDPSPFVIDNAGNVGIGATAPASKLEIRSGTTNAITMSHGSGAGYDTTITSNYSATQSFSLASAGFSVLSFRPGDAAAVVGAILRLDRGASAPVFWLNGASGTDQVGLKAGSGAAGAMEFYTSGAEQMRISSGGNLGIGTASPNAASIVDAQSTTKGVRFPNMTTTQKNLIANVAGNVVFDTTLGKLCVNSGSGWQTITSV